MNSVTMMVPLHIVIRKGSTKAAKKGLVLLFIVNIADVMLVK